MTKTLSYKAWRWFHSIHLKIWKSKISHKVRHPFANAKRQMRIWPNYLVSYHTDGRSNFAHIIWTKLDSSGLSAIFSTCFLDNIYLPVLSVHEPAIWASWMHKEYANDVRHYKMNIICDCLWFHFESVTYIFVGNVRQEKKKKNEAKFRHRRQVIWEEVIAAVIVGSCEIM